MASGLRPLGSRPLAGGAPVFPDITGGAGSPPNLKLDGSVAGTATATSTAVTLTTTGAGLVILNIELNGGPVVSVSDTAGLTWALRKRQLSSAGTPNYIEEWYASSPGVLTSDVITVTQTSSAFMGVHAYAIKGGVGFDGAPVSAGSGDPIHIVTTNPNAMVLGNFRVGGGPTWNAGDGWTSIQVVNFAVSECFLASEAFPFFADIVPGGTNSSDESAANGSIVDVLFGSGTLSLDGSGSNSTTATSTTVAITTTGAGYIVVSALLNGGPGASVSDTTGLTWSLRTRQLSSSGAPNYLEEWYAVSAGAVSTTITVTQTSSAFITVAACGVKNATGFDRPARSSADKSVYVATSQANSFVLHSQRSHFNSVQGTITPYTSIYSNNFLLMEYKATSSADNGLLVRQGYLGTGASNGIILDAVVAGTPPTTVVKLDQQFVEVLAADANGGSIQLDQQFVEVVTADNLGGTIQVDQQFLEVIINYDAPSAQTVVGAGIAGTENFGLPSVRLGTPLSVFGLGIRGTENFGVPAVARLDPNVIIPPIPGGNGGWQLAGQAGPDAAEHGPAMQAARGRLYKKPPRPVWDVQRRQEIAAQQAMQNRPEAPKQKAPFRVVMDIPAEARPLGQQAAMRQSKISLSLNEQPSGEKLIAGQWKGDQDVADALGVINQLADQMLLAAQQNPEGSE